MKKIKIYICMLIVFCLISALSVVAFAAPIDNKFSENEFSTAVSALEEKYDVEISVTPTKLNRTTLSAEKEAEELANLEERLSIGQAALEENNKLAEENWQSIVESGRLNGGYSIPENTIFPRATYTVYRNQTIGSYYPNGTTIRCYITGNKTYSNSNKRYLWGSVVSKGSKLYSGKGDSWKQTDCEVQRIDGGRTYYVQVWGDLTEKYTSWFYEYTVTSKGWRIWYEAYCPA